MPDSSKTTPDYPPERPMGDYLGRTDKDFAIEFGGYLATAAEHFIKAAAHRHPFSDERADSCRALESAIYEFRKRAGLLK